MTYDQGKNEAMENEDTFKKRALESHLVQKSDNGGLFFDPIIQC